jgi:tetratricopeptide (TPR) repeat protein
VRKRRIVVERLAVVANLAVAAPASANTASARASFQRGRSLFDAGETRAACRAFQESLDDELDFETLYQLAACHEQLGNLASSWRMFTRLGNDDPDPGRRARAAELAKNLWQRVAKVIVTVKEPPTQLAVTLDGEAIAAKLDLEIPIDPGQHTVVATAPGYREWRTTANVDPATAEVRVSIALEAADAPSHDASVVVQYRRKRLGRRALGTGLMIGGAVGVAASFAISTYELGKYNDALERIENNEGSIADAVDDANHARRVARWVATPIFVAGAVCAGAGLVLYLRSNTVVLTPIVSSAGAGVGFAGSF